jgi:hypothetical protein
LGKTAEGVPPAASKAYPGEEERFCLVDAPGGEGRRGLGAEDLLAGF